MKLLNSFLIRSVLIIALSIGIVSSMVGQYKRLDAPILIVGAILSLLLATWFILEIIYHFNNRRRRLEKRILERNKQWMEMKKESEDYKFALDQSSIVSITNVDRVIKYVNDNFCKVSKYSRAEVIGRDHQILNSGFHSNEFMKDLRQTIADGKIFKGEIKNKAKDGTFYWVESTIVPFLNKQAKPYQYLAISSDITILKKAEQEIINSENHFKALIENAPDVIVLLDEEARMTYISPSFVKATGFSHTEMIGTNAFGIVSSDMVEKSKTAMFEVLKNPGVVYPRLNRFMCKDGSTIWCEGSIVNLLHDENIKAIVVNYKNITDRKLAEEQLAESNMRFKLLIENNYDAVLLVDKNLNFFYESPSAERISGWNLDNLKTKGILDLLHPDDKAEVQMQIDKTLHQPGMVQHSVHRFLNKNGNYFWADATLTNLLDTPGINGLLINMSDVSEKKKVEERMILINEELEEKVLERTEDLLKTNKELEMFTSSVSHDLRTPLSAIDGFATLLKEFHHNELNEEGKLYVDNILTSTKRMNKLIEDLLKLSKWGKKSIRKEEINTTDLIKNVLHNCKEKTKANQPNLHLHLLPIIFADHSLLEQVWVNLISNAIKYSAKKENPLIEIGCIETENYFEFFIQDNGAGFDMKYVDKLFGVFQRMHSNSEFEGTGVGLAIVKLIIEKHSGKIWVNSKLNEGTTFYFTIPKEPKKEVLRLQESTVTIRN